MYGDAPGIATHWLQMVDRSGRLGARPEEDSVPQPTVTRTIDLAAPAAAVWTVLGDRDGLAGWLAAAPTPAPTPAGGPLVAGAVLDVDRDGTGVLHRLVVTEAAEGRVGFLWWKLDDPAEVTRVELAVDDVDGGSRVTVTETLAGELAGAGRGDCAAATLDLTSRWDDRLTGLLGLVAFDLVGATV
jgi:uncharacterized protein YndB with AHSA1/START domain